MRALYLYFAEPADPPSDRSSPGPGSRPVEARPADDGPLVPIQPGAYSRWMANRNRVVAENAAALRGAVNNLAVRRSRPEPTG